MDRSGLFHLFLKITYSFIFGSVGSSCRTIFPPVGTSGDYSDAAARGPLSAVASLAAQRRL